MVPVVNKSRKTRCYEVCCPVFYTVILIDVRMQDERSQVLTTTGLIICVS